jgi:hypothetical protein
MHLQNFENFGNECAEIKNQFLIFRKSLCKIAGNPWKSILKSINQNAFFFPGGEPWRNFIYDSFFFLFTNDYRKYQILFLSSAILVML